MVTFVLHKPDGDPVTPSFFGLADSGADGSMFPMDVMKDLGIDKGDCDELRQFGAGGKAQYYRWKGGTLPATFFGTVTVNLQIQFSETPFILLGRADFFATFKVGFDQRRLQFVVETH